MVKYIPRIGKDFSVKDMVDIEKMRHQHFAEKVVLFVGIGIILIFLYFIFINLPIDGIKGLWMSDILSIGVAALTIGIAGTLNVEYKGSGLSAKGGYGLAAFLLVYIVSTVIYWPHSPSH